MKNNQFKLQFEAVLDLDQLLKSPENVEKILWEEVRKFKESLLQITFERMESSLLKQKTLVLKDRRKKTFHTLLGEIPYARYRVFDRRLKTTRYPLDESLGLKPSEKICPHLKKELLRLTVDLPFRRSANEIQHWTGNTLNKDRVWGVSQSEGGNCWREKSKTRRWNRNESLPEPGEIVGDEKPAEVLCIGLDGTYVKRQEKKQRLKTRHDVKLAVLYTGKKIKNGDVVLDNRQTVVAAPQESLDQFLGRVVNKGIEHYGLNQNTTVLLFGDGDMWIKRFKDFVPQAHYRLDPWHVMEKIRMYLGIKQIPTNWVKLIYGKPDILIAEILQFTKALASDQENQKAQDLIRYLKNNREGLLAWEIPQDLKKRHWGLFKWGSGQVESQIELAICDRHKQNRMSWSKKGLQNLSTLREDKINNHQKPKFKCTKPPKPFRIDLGALGVIPIYPQ